ncbi:rod shape-determining protein MreB [Spirochaetota bacterium]|nr:rod shape-determining protein MreB [Spirochaetota bacterium]
MSMFSSLISRDIGIDLGTANTLIYLENEGIVLNEPSVVAIEKATNHVISIGTDAKYMLGRTPGAIIAVRPLRDGVIADFEIVEKMIRYFINKISPRKTLLNPRVVIGIPTGITEVEKRAVLESCEQAGAREIYLIEEPLAAAIGAGMPTSLPLGNMIVDIGGGTTEIAVISLGSIVVERSIPVGGNEIDQAVVDFVKDAFNVVIGQRSAEDIKTTFADLWNIQSKETYAAKGRDAISGLPRSQEMTLREVKEAIMEPVKKIIFSIKSVLDQTPPELSADIMEHGIVVSGGGALLKGFKKMLSHETGVPVVIANNPTECVAVGTGIYLAQLKEMQHKKKYLKI